MSDLPKRISIAEEGPREGFQSEKKMIPVADKVRLIEALADTGLKHIACVSYVNPKRVPTMADAEEVAQAIRRKPGIEYAALWLNQQGLERALRGPLHVDGGIRVTASIGVATYTTKQRFPSTLALLEAADHALYTAKLCGRNRVECYDELPISRRGPTTARS